MRAVSVIILLIITVVACAPPPATPTYPPSAQPPTFTPMPPTLTPTPTVTATSTQTPHPTSTIVPTLTPSPEALTLTPPEHITPDELRVLGGINAWRVNIGLWPLAPNTELSALAQAQADYLASLNTWPANIHMDASGGMAVDRAKAAGWPAYDDQRTAFAVTEIIATGETPAEAVTWWRGSEIHTWVIEAPYYREVGVGSTPRPWGGSTYVVVVGSRPNVLPALLDPLENTLYMSDELYSGGYDGILYDVQRVQILAGTALNEDAWQPYSVSAVVAEPPTAVRYADQRAEVTITVDWIAWLPEVVTAALDE